MQELELKASPREVLGKKVRFLRRQGIVPVHIFGRNVASLSLQCSAADMQRVLPQAGMTGLISLRLNRETEPRNVMVREIQKNPITGEVLHVDLYQVSMTERIKAEVPIVLTGEAPALKIKENIMVQGMDNLTIESLPGQIPSSVELDVSSLTEAHQEIRVKNIILSDRVTVVSDPDSVIVRISILRAEKAEEVVAAPVTEEGAAPAEGEEAAEEQAEE